MQSMLTKPYEKAEYKRMTPILLKFSSLSTAWISLFLYYNMKWLKYPHPLS
jgi:hypothetical protein